MQWTALNPVDTDVADPLFEAIQDDPLKRALLKGFHGRILVDDAKAPNVACGHVGWTYYVAGDVSHPHAKKLLESLPSGIEVLSDNPWKNEMQTFFGERARLKTRYAMDHRTIEPCTLFPFIQKVKERYRIELIDKKHYQTIIEESWGKDFVIHFKDFDDYRTNGLGFVALDGEKIVGGVSSYARFPGGFDIEIITHESYRRQGIARGLGALYIKTCLEKGLIPYWDAAHMQSRRLAESLGYTLDHAFEVIEIVKGNQGTDQFFQYHSL